VWFIFLVEVDMALNQIPVTIIGAELMKAELQKLRSDDRPNVIQAIAEARAQGDLSENAEYEAAKEKQSFIEGRIAELESKLSNLFVIDPKTLHAEGRVVFGATVRFEDLDSGDTKTYQIVGEDEANIKGGKISVGSPIARALIGKSEGDIAEVQSPGGVKELEVLEVSYI
jgi:transcription elongation factor GreA